MKERRIVRNHTIEMFVFKNIAPFSNELAAFGRYQKPNETKANTCPVAIEQLFDFECPVECPGIWCFGNPLPFCVSDEGEYSSPVSRSQKASVYAGLQTLAFLF